MEAERQKTTSPGIIYRMTVATIIAAVTLVLALALCGCTTTRYVPVERVTHHTDTVRELAVRIDSVMTRDSVAVYISGDTVYLTKYRDRFRYRECIDTVYQSATDSVEVRVPQPYPVERKLTAWEKTRLDTWGWIATALILCIGWICRKPLITLARRLLKKTT